MVESRIMDSGHNYLTPFVEFLKRLFPAGLGQNDYLLLLSAMHEDFSQRVLARVVSGAFGRDYYVVLHDVYVVGSPAYTPDRVAVESVRRKLESSGYLEFLEKLA